MSVLHVISGLGLGGAERALVQIATTLHARGVPQHVVSLTRQDHFGSELLAGGIPPAFFNFGAATAPLELMRLAALVARLRPTAIQGWMYHGNLIATLAHRLAPGRARRRLLWNLRASDMDFARYRRIIRWTARLSRQPDVIVANSESGARVHERLGYRPRRLEIIPNGIDTERFRPNADLRRAVRTELGLPPGQVVALHVARVDPMKDHPGFLAAMQPLPHLAGLLVGEGTERLTLPPNVQALGAQRDVERCYAAADLIVSSSAFGEGFSNVLAEGMSAGLTAVATDVGDARLIVGDTGQVVPPADAVALSAAIAAEAQRPEAERHARRTLARRRIVERYSSERAVAAYQRLYAVD